MQHHYSLNRNIENFEYIALVNRAFTNLEPSMIYDEIPPYFKSKYRLLSKYEALHFVHKPTSYDDIHKGLRVLKYEECLLFCLKTQMIRSKNKESIDYVKTKIDVDKVNEFINNLPYKLTSDQLKAVNEALKDMNSPNLMYRLLQGDVGTGKTLVAAIALYGNYLRGDQGAFMAPTDALAKQHYKNLYKMFAPLGIKVGLLVGSKSVKDRAAVRRALINKEIDIVVEMEKLKIMLEVKYREQAKISKDDLIVEMATEKYPNLVITKKATDFGECEYGDKKIYRIPAPAFLYMLGFVEKQNNL